MDGWQKDRVPTVSATVRPMEPVAPRIVTFLAMVFLPVFVDYFVASSMAESAFSVLDEVASGEMSEAEYDLWKAKFKL